MVLLFYLVGAMIVSVLITMAWQDDFDGEFIAIVMLISMLWPLAATALLIMITFGWPIVLVIFIRKWLKHRKA